MLFIIYLQFVFYRLFLSFFLALILWSVFYNYLIFVLIKDLKERGLFDETLIIIGGEFGRTPFREGRTSKGSVLGRDHFPDCYSMVMAGGGVKGGHVHGESDELGFGVAKDPVHVHDLQATWMHLLGFDHEQLTYRFQGRDYRLTDVHGHVVKDLIA